MENKNIYVGSGKKFGKFDNISISICLEDVKPFMTKSEKNGKHYVNLVVAEMKEANKWGKTHSVSIDNWKPDPNYKKEIPVIEVPAEDKEEDLPF